MITASDRRTRNGTLYKVLTTRYVHTKESVVVVTEFEKEEQLDEVWEVVVVSVASGEEWWGPALRRASNETVLQIAVLSFHSLAHTFPTTFKFIDWLVTHDMTHTTTGTQDIRGCEMWRRINRRYQDALKKKNRSAVPENNHRGGL